MASDPEFTLDESDTDENDEVLELIFYTFTSNIYFYVNSTIRIQYDLLTTQQYMPSNYIYAEMRRKGIPVSTK